VNGSLQVSDFPSAFPLNIISSVQEVDPKGAKLGRLIEGRATVEVIPYMTAC